MEGQSNGRAALPVHGHYYTGCRSGSQDEAASCGFAVLQEAALQVSNTCRAHQHTISNQSQSQNLS